MGEGSQCVACSLDPLYDVRLFLRSIPNTGNVYFVTGLSERKSGSGRTYTTHSTAQGHNDQLAGHGGIVDCCRNRRKRGPAECAKKEIRLEVGNRPGKKPTCCLGFQVGHDFDRVILWLKRAQRSDQVISHLGVAATAEINLEFATLGRRQQLGESVHFVWGLS